MVIKIIIKLLDCFIYAQARHQTINSKSLKFIMWIDHIHWPARRYWPPLTNRSVSTLKSDKAIITHLELQILNISLKLQVLNKLHLLYSYHYCLRWKVDLIYLNANPSKALSISWKLKSQLFNWFFLFFYFSRKISSERSKFNNRVLECLGTNMSLH